MKRLTEKVDGKIIFTPEGYRLYCSSQATAEMLFCYEEQLDKEITPHSLEEQLLTCQQIIAQQQAQIQKMQMQLDDLEHIVAMM